MYGMTYSKHFVVGENQHFLSAFLHVSPWFSMLAWLVFTCGVGLLLTAMRRADPLADEAADFFEDPVGVTEDEIWDDGEDEDSLEDDPSGNGGPIQ